MPPPLTWRSRTGQTSAAATADAYPEPMTHAHELPADDPDAVRQAVTRAAAGERVRLVAADGRRIADVTPPADETLDERNTRVTRTLMDAGQGVPGFEHYRDVYRRMGLPYPGDDTIAARYPVRPAS